MRNRCENSYDRRIADFVSRRHCLAGIRGGFQFDLGNIEVRNINISILKRYLTRPAFHLGRHFTDEFNL